MSTSRRIVSAFCAAAAVLVAALPARAGLDDVKVTTDTSIDCSSLATIARDLYGGCKSDHDKAIATWYFVRRVEFHWPHVPTWDTIDLINSYGFGLCGYQSTAFAQICTAGGLKARLCHLPGHVIAEAFYNSGWHMFDCQVGWYALNRQGKVASCQEMKDDPSLVTRAVEEGRASKPYFQCRDNPRGGTNYAARARGGESLRTVPTTRLVINLRRGESITRVWGNEKKPWFADKGNDGRPNTSFLEPAHLCTAAGVDENDPVNWPFWKPYALVASRDGGKIRYGLKRYYGNGRMVYAPDLTSPACLADLPRDALANVQPGPTGLQPAEAGRDASVTIPVECPYVITDAWLNASAFRADGKDVLALAVRGRGGQWKEVYRAGKTGRLTLERFSLKDAAFGGKKYQVRITLRSAAKTADVSVARLTLTTVFINNMYALPYLSPGRNTVRITAADGVDLATNRLALEYAWQEEGADKTLTRVIDRLPFQAVIEVGGRELPRMKSVRLSVAP